MVGVRFRRQGHEAATGLDCVGLVWAAYAAAGHRLVRPTDYPLRGWGREKVEAALRGAGFSEGEGSQLGDVALFELPAGQFHLGLIGERSFVHAHAGLRRVVETPLGGGSGVRARWRLRTGSSRCDSGAGAHVSPTLPQAEGTGVYSGAVSWRLWC